MNAIIDVLEMRRLASSSSEVDPGRSLKLC